MTEAADRSAAVEHALTVAKSALATLGARAVARDSRQLVALLRRVEEAGHVGLLASHLEGAEHAQVLERIAVVTVLARVRPERFARSAAMRAGGPELRASLAALRPGERASVLLERHGLDWAALEAVALDAGGVHPSDTLSEVEHEAAAHLVPVGLTAVRSDKELAADFAAELEQRAGVRLEPAEVREAPPGRLLGLVRDRAPAKPPEPAGAPLPSPAAADGIVLQWAMSPQCVLRVFLHDAEGVRPPSAAGELFTLDAGHRLLLERADGQVLEELDPSQTDKILRRDDVVRLVAAAPLSHGSTGSPRS